MSSTTDCSTWNNLMNRKYNMFHVEHIWNCFIPTKIFCEDY